MTGTFDRLAAVLVRRKWVVLGTMLLTVAGAAGSAHLMPPLYRAEARVLVSPPSVIATEAELARSSDVSRQVVSALQLDRDPEFGGRKREGTFLSLSVGADIPPALFEDFRARLTVRPVPEAGVLAIDFTSSDPVKAALIANTLAELYIRARAGFAEPRADGLDGLRADLRQSESRLLALRQKGAELRTEQAELSGRYGPRHPRMVVLASQLAELSRSIAEEVASSSAAADQIGMLQQAPPEARSKNEIRLISPAVAPSASLRAVPSWSYAAASGIGLLLGLGLAAVNERLDRRVGSLRQLEDLTGLTCAASLRLTRADASDQAASVLQKPAGATADAVRSLRAFLKLKGESEGRAIRVVTVTSPRDGEARALLSVWLARLAARAGEKVLLIDANLRAPSLHDLLKRSNTPSLVDYLTGQTHLEQIVWKQDPSGAHVIFASAVPNSAPDLIGSAKMTKLMGYLRQGYELVVLCAPPCLDGADAALLCNESDYTLYVADTGATDRDDLLRGLALFAGFNYKALSPVLTETKA